MTGIVKPFQVWNNDRSLKKSITASSLQDLIEKGCLELGLNQTLPFRVVLEEDGTEVDEEEYFSFLPGNTIFVFLQNNERWRPGGAESKAKDELDSSSASSMEKDALRSLIASLKCNVANIITFSPSEFEQLVDYNTSELAELIGQSERYTQKVQDECQRHLDKLAEVNDVFDLLKLYHRAQLYHRAKSSISSPP